jgi:hypothetical protein
MSKITNAMSEMHKLSEQLHAVSGNAAGFAEVIGPIRAEQDLSKVTDNGGPFKPGLSPARWSKDLQDSHRLITHSLERGHVPVAQFKAFGEYLSYGSSSKDVVAKADHLLTDLLSKLKPSDLHGKDGEKLGQLISGMLAHFEHPSKQLLAQADRLQLHRTSKLASDDK